MEHWPPRGYDSVPNVPLDVSCRARQRGNGLHITARLTVCFRLGKNCCDQTKLGWNFAAERETLELRDSMRTVRSVRAGKLDKRKERLGVRSGFRSNSIRYFVLSGLLVFDTVRRLTGGR